MDVVGLAATAATRSPAHRSGIALLAKTPVGGRPRSATTRRGQVTRSLADDTIARIAKQNVANAQPDPATNNTNAAE